VRPQRLVPALFAWSVIALAGCGGGQPEATPAPKDPEGALNQLGETYRYLSIQKLKTPTQLADLSEYSGNLEAALPLLQSGDLVLFFNVPYSSGSKDVLAHQKDAPTSGGWVLLRNGTVSKLTAEEFKAAPKAGKK